MTTATLALETTIGNGSKLYAVIANGENWGGFGTWRVRAETCQEAIALALSQYDDVPEDDRPTEWEGFIIGTFAN